MIPEKEWNNNMFEIKGKNGTVKVVDTQVDEKVTSHMYKILDSPAFTNQIVIMPDYHEGKGAVIGFTMPMTDKVVPSVIGVDIGCGMLSMNVGKDLFKTINYKEANRKIRNIIPFGPNVNDTVDKESKMIIDDIYPPNIKNIIPQLSQKLSKTYFYEPYTKSFAEKCQDWEIEPERVYKSVGSLGSGNHFIEIGISKNTEDYWITVHSGSRQLGLKIANYWQKKAGKNELDYLAGDNLVGYLADMYFAQLYASVNRNTIMDKIYNSLFNKFPNIDIKKIESIHNYINFDDFIIRKGAIASYNREQMIIPFNMEDGVLICEGKSNSEWNYSAPHGAGRVGSRAWAKENLSLTEAEERMQAKGIFSSYIPLDESKSAYKDSGVIEKAIEPTATIIDRISPVLNLKA